MRDDSDTESDLDGAFYRLDIVEFGDLVHIDAVVAENFVDGLSSRHIALEMDKILALNIFHAKLGALCKLMIGWNDQDETVTWHRHDRQSSSRFRKGEYTEFDAAIKNVANNSRRSRIFKVDLRCGKLGHKFPYLGRQLMQADTVDCRDFYRTANPSYQAAQAFLQMVVTRKHVSRFFVKNLTGRSKTNFATTANAL